MARILFLCTGNNCRSKMEQTVLQYVDRNLIICSADTHPFTEVNPLAIRVIDEMNMPITDLQAHAVSEYEQQDWD